MHKARILLILPRFRQSVKFYYFDQKKLIQQIIDMHKQEIISLIEEVNLLIKSSKLSTFQIEYSEIQAKLEDPNLWQNNQTAGENTNQDNSTETPTEKSTRLSKQARQLEDKINDIQVLINNIADVQAALDLGEEDLLSLAILELQKNYKKYQEKNYLDGQHDFNNCLLTIHAGTGGVDAEDFAAMICSMYQAFCKKQNWYVQTISISVGQEGGLKTVTLDIQGEYAYGLMKEEVGVHRLVRISPFNSGKTRETSFAMVEALPQGLEEAGQIELKEEELRWEYSTASGNGGQSVNTTYSAVKLIHVPTGLTVSCQNERSQVQNKQQALKYLKDKLAILEWERQQKLKQEIRGEYNSVEWGSQIRNYVLHPYKLVKDVRSGWETSNTNKVLEEGDILEIIWSVKRSKGKL